MSTFSRGKATEPKYKQWRKTPPGLLCILPCALAATGVYENLEETFIAIGGPTFQKDVKPQLPRAKRPHRRPWPRHRNPTSAAQEILHNVGRLAWNHVLTTVATVAEMVRVGSPPEECGRS